MHGLEPTVQHAFSRFQQVQSDPLATRADWQSVLAAYHPFTLNGSSLTHPTTQEDIISLFGLVEALLQVREGENAEQATNLLKAVPSDLHSPHYFLLSGLAHEANNALHCAASDFQQLVTKEDSVLEHHRHHARIRMYLEEFHKAEEEYLIVIEREQSIRSHTDLGMILILKGNYKQAITQLKTALRHHGSALETAAAYAHLGDAHRCLSVAGNGLFRKRRNDTAVNFYRLALHSLQTIHDTWQHDHYLVAARITLGTTALGKQLGPDYVTKGKDYLLKREIDLIKKAIPS